MVQTSSRSGSIFVVVALVSLLAFAKASLIHAARFELCPHQESKNKVHLSSLDDLRQVSTVGCSEEVVLAVEALKDMTEMERNICTLARAKKITDFYETYMSDQNKGGSSLPKELARFAILYGLIVGRDCKVFMHDLYSENPLDESDYAALRPWTSDDGHIADLLELVPVYGRIFPLPSDFSSLHPGFEDELMQTLRTEEDTTGKQGLGLAQEACKYRFRPVYENMALSIAQLDRHGLAMDSELSFIELARSKDTHFFRRIIFLCELLLGQSNTNQPKSIATSKIPLEYNPKHYSHIIIPADPYSSLGAYLRSFNAALKPEERFSQVLLEPIYVGEYPIETRLESSNDNTRRIMEKVIDSAQGYLERMAEERLRVREMVLAARESEKNESQHSDRVLVKPKMFKRIFGKGKS